MLRDDLHGWVGWKGRFKREGICVYIEVTHSVVQQKPTTL